MTAMEKKDLRNGILFLIFLLVLIGFLWNKAYASNRKTSDNLTIFDIIVEANDDFYSHRGVQKWLH